MHLFFITKNKVVPILCVNCDQVLQIFLPVVLMTVGSNYQYYVGLRYNYSTATVQIM